MPADEDGIEPVDDNAARSGSDANPGASDATPAPADGGASPAQTPAPETAQDGKPATRGSNKRFAAIAIALVAVVAVAAIAYRQLAPKTETATQQQIEQAASSSSKSQNSASTQAASTAAAKDFQATTLDGTAVSFSDLRAGKPAVINFWATWCPYCVAEMDDWQQLYDEYGDKVEFVMVTPIDSRQDGNDVSAYISENSYSFPVYLDHTGSAFNAYRAQSLPTTAIISSDGSVVTEFAGVIDKDSVSQLLDSLAQS